MCVLMVDTHSGAPLYKWRHIGHRVNQMDSKRASLSVEQYAAVMQKISKHNSVSRLSECQRGNQNTLCHLLD